MLQVARRARHGLVEKARVVMDPRIEPQRPRLALPEPPDRRLVVGGAGRFIDRAERARRRARPGSPRTDDAAGTRTARSRRPGARAARTPRADRPPPLRADRTRPGRRSRRPGARCAARAGAMRRATASGAAARPD